MQNAASSCGLTTFASFAFALIGTLAIARKYFRESQMFIVIEISNKVGKVITNNQTLIFHRLCSDVELQGKVN